MPEKKKSTGTKRISKNDMVLQAIEKMNARFDNIDTRLDNIDTRLDNVDTRLDKMQKDVNSRLNKIETDVAEVKDDIKYIKIGQKENGDFISALRVSSETHKAENDNITINIAKISSSVAAIEKNMDNLKEKIDDIFKSNDDIKSNLGLIVDVMTESANSNTSNVAKLKAIK